MDFAFIKDIKKAPAVAEAFVTKGVTISR